MLFIVSERKRIRDGIRYNWSRYFVSLYLLNPFPILLSVIINTMHNIQNTLFILFHFNHPYHNVCRNAVFSDNCVVADWSLPVILKKKTCFRMRYILFFFSQLKIFEDKIIEEVTILSDKSIIMESYSVQWNATGCELHAESMWFYTFQVFFFSAFYDFHKNELY